MTSQTTQCNARGQEQFRAFPDIFLVPPGNDLELMYQDLIVTPSGGAKVCPSCR